MSRPNATLAAIDKSILDERFGVLTWTALWIANSNREESPTDVGERRVSDERGVAVELVALSATGYFEARAAIGAATATWEPSRRPLDLLGRWPAQQLSAATAFVPHGRDDLAMQWAMTLALGWDCAA